MPGDKLVLYLLVIPAACLFIAEYSGVIYEIKKYLFYRKYTKETRFNEMMVSSLKPFSCGMCLSFWIGAVCLLKCYSSWIDLLLPFASAGMAVIINRLINR